MPKYKKLVRDRIPDIIRENGEVPIVRKLSQSEYKKELLKKLVEESGEAVRAKDKKHLVNELTDIEETILAVMEVFRIDCKDVTKERNTKKKERGAFAKRIYLEGVK